MNSAEGSVAADTRLIPPPSRQRCPPSLSFHSAACHGESPVRAPTSLSGRVARSRGSAHARGSRDAPVSKITANEKALRQADGTAVARTLRKGGENKVERENGKSLSGLQVHRNYGWTDVHEHSSLCSSTSSSIQLLVFRCTLFPPSPALFPSRPGPSCLWKQSSTGFRASLTAEVHLRAFVLSCSLFRWINRRINQAPAIRDSLLKFVLLPPLRNLCSCNFFLLVLFFCFVIMEAFFSWL